MDTNTGAFVLATNLNSHTELLYFNYRYIYQAAKYVTMQGDLVRVRATKKFGTSQKPWFDSAIVQFDASDDPENEKYGSLVM